MLISDRKFLQFIKEKRIRSTPQDEKKFEKIEKAERAFSSVGGAFLAYASSKLLTSKTQNPLLSYAMALAGGALILRGLLKSGKAVHDSTIEASDNTSARK